MASSVLSTLELTDRNAAHARRWAARLCLANDEREARRTLWEAFLDLGFEAVAGLRWHSASGASVLWRTPAVPAAFAGDPPAPAGWHAEAQLDLGVKIWSIRRNKPQPHDGGGAEAYADFRQLREAFGLSPWRLLLSVPHHTDTQTLSVGAASTAPFEERRECVGTVRFLSDLYFALRTGRWQEDERYRAPPSLTPPQISCLRWAVAGKTYQDIGAITGLSPRTVRFHLENARKTYGFATITQTLVQAAKDFDLDPFDGRRR